MWEQLRSDPSGSITQVLPALRRLVREAVREDVGRGDVSSCIFHRSMRGSGVFLAKQAGVVSGLEVASLVFEQVSPECQFRPLMKDGAHFKSGAVLAEVHGPLAALLTGERTSLNFLQQLSGVATLTSRFVKAIGKGGPGIYDTRKTVPLLRWLQKRAVWHGGGHNHRFGLDDMAMLKNNHVDTVGGVKAAVALLRARGFFRKGLRLCVEARNAGEALEALGEGANIIMLDNMAPTEMRRVVRMLQADAKRRGCDMPHIEVSGGVTLENIAKMRGLPVDRISIGALTHSAPAVDISLRIRVE